MPFPLESCGHKENSPLGGDPGTNGLLTDNRSNCGHCCSNLYTTPVVSKSAKVHAAYTSLPPRFDRSSRVQEFPLLNLAQFLHILCRRWGGCGVASG